MPAPMKDLSPKAPYRQRALILRSFLEANRLSYDKIQRANRHEYAVKWLEKAVHGEAVPPDEWLRSALTHKGTPDSWLKFWREWTRLDVEEVDPILKKAVRLPDVAVDLVALSSYNIDHVMTTTVLRNCDIEVSQGQSQAEDGHDVIVDDLASFEQLLRGQPGKLGLRVGGSALNTCRLLDEAERFEVAAICAIGSTIKRSKLSEADADFTERLVSSSEGAGGLVADCRPVEAGQCLVEPVRLDDQRWSRRLNTFPGANTSLADYIYANFQRLVAYLSAAKIVHVSSFYDLDSANAVANLLRALSIRSPQTLISFDPGTNWTKKGNPFGDVVRHILRVTSFLFVNHNEFRSLADAQLDIAHDDDTTAARALLRDRLKPGAAVVVVKLVGRTRVYRERDGTPREFKIEVANDDDIEDDTGAGDVFAAGFLAARLDDRLSEEDGAMIGMHLARTKILSDSLPSGTVLRDLIEAAAAGARAAA